MTFATRRWLNAAVAVVVSLLVIVSHAAYSTTLGNEAFLSGWALLAVVLFLTLYNLRRKLPFLPLGSSALWLQFHIYAGLVSVVVFVLHIGGRMPNDAFETALALLYFAVAGSGLLGIFVARGLPPRLSRRGEEVLFERIPLFRRQLMEATEALVQRSVEESGSTTIADYYSDRLRSFFDGPRNFWHHLAESNRGRHRLLTEMRALERYLNESERVTLGEIAEVTCVKDDLDYQYALQAMLRRWQFVHVPLTYGLLIVVAVHIVLVHAFA